ncbi:HAD hydrolase-like protein [Nocardia sp. NBC_01503]|uniref:HAD family hydrolase n=1 Tax=Nocardia sp. NBC_01503 TaxID=2975997 RepID=UPI002E7BCBC3|nr:HAD family hydrolase [Nocardia sp. NBC_01503]WTL30418.1 HAD hydrolase-like protein [Nocardia sp. NBC_01503]
MAIEAVLFDFSGTVFRFEESEFWDAELTDADGRSLDTHEVAAIMRAMTAPVGQLFEFDDQGQYAWDRRDLDPALHRTAYLQVLERSGVPQVPAEQLYERMLDPKGWTPYGDTGEVLEQLHERGIPVAIVSNIAWDIRPAFATRGWDRYIGHFALSFEIGAIKPDRGIFESALENLGIAPENALMIGDSLEADGGATALGADFALVQPLPIADRPTALRDALVDRGLIARPR